MKRLSTIFILVICLFQLNGQGIFDSDIHTAIPFGDVSSPPTETAQQVIDQDPDTKFLDFFFQDGMGFEVNVGSATIATSIAIVTANDAPERDPQEYEIFGSNDGSDYTSIATGTIPCVTERFLSRTFAFSNTEAYSIYRVNFTGTCGPSTILQVADVQLFEMIGSAPVMSCPESLTVDSSPGECSGIANFEVTVSDLEDGTVEPTLTLGFEAGSAYPVGNTPVVYTAVDSDGNIVSCNFTVTVLDVESPVFECPDDMTVNVDQGATGATVNFDVAVSDNCSVINPIDDFTPLGTMDNQSYYLSNSLFVPEDAAFTDAPDNGGTLGTIRNEEENMYILNAVREPTSGLANILIGYTDISSEGEFEWFSGDPSDYNNWNEGEPNNSGPSGEPENYTIMLGNGTWNDIASLPSQTYRYLLEVEYELLQTAGLASGSTFPLGTTTNSFVATDVAGNSSNCEFTVTVDNTSSTENHFLANSISLTPNPSSDWVTISNESNLALKNIIIFDIYGKMVFMIDQDQINDNPAIDISELLTGIYLMEIQTERGSITKKLLKQ
ncbi:MAG: HYR domain-containing protein [Bacteroidetes bacterium]|nr:MAG: HYR domain-containing protein [Bacteroidota bacterium]